MTGRNSGESTDVENRRSQPARSTVSRLERIRNNQRRSRARKKEYVDALERKLQGYEASNNRDPTNDDETLRRLLKENASLKTILNSIGVNETLQRELAEAFERVPMLTNLALGRAVQQQGTQAKAAITTGVDQSSSLYTSGDAMSTIEAVSNTDGLEFLVQSPDAGIADNQSLVDSIQWVQQDFDSLQLPIDLSNYIDPAVVQSHSHRVLEIQSTQNAISSSPVELSRIECSSSQASTATTTLCSIAYELVLKYNHKAYTMEELDQRLRCGYSGGCLMNEGCSWFTRSDCSVNNKVLFRVLAEIC
ncbi:hypothetical protein TWF694_006750 [Orbilia ellipsospora]|uniref:BZIP domain-containing protein n=1 Tax=Orbilia ellipsospora TaxID=2528407 RepID=A0AAV9XLI4_9PEZI